MGSDGISRRGLLGNLLARGAGLAGLAALPLSAAGKDERLKITKIEVFQVVIPIQDDIINSPEFNPDGLSEFPKGPKVIVKLHTDSGIVGIGETSRNVPKEGGLENAKYLTGKNALDQNLSRLNLPDRRTQAAFEIALYDAIGKAFGWPVYQLLGGLAQDKVFVPYWCGRKNAADARRVAERTLAGGFKALKMKGRPGDPILEAVRAVSQVAPDVKITVDFNRHYETAAEFLPIGEALDEIGNMRTIEDPVGDLGELAKLSKSLKTPITLTAGGPARIIAGIQAEACRYINTGPSPSMRGFGINAAVAGGAGMPVWHGSGHELGIKDAAFVHSCAAAENCTLPSDILSYQRVDDLLVRSIEIKNGYATVPRTAGLGVELDEDALRRYAV